ncbi:MAG: hypothetical protein PHY58_11110, partial [Bacteroidales bacterium]|nr:hypothetical protein [Bacteroidales bacterium]
PEHNAFFVLRNPKSEIGRGVAPTVLLFVVDASFYHSVAPTALLFVVDASFYHSVAPMALILRRSPCALRPL